MIEIPWRIGVNMREFAYYELPECRRYPLASPPTREAQLDALQELGVPLVRFFAGHRALDIDANLKQVGKALDLIGARKMQAIVCIGDSIAELGHIIPGDEDYHKDTDMGHFHKRYWNERRYEEHYLPFVRLLAEQYGDHPAVLVWELGNELALHPRRNLQRPDVELVTEEDFDNFVTFVRSASHEIKTRSLRKLISTGMINTNQIAPDDSGDEQRARYARVLYSLPDVDLISIHYYAEDADDHLTMIDVMAANDLQKPVYVGELGANVEETPDRPQFIRDAIARWRETDQHAFSVLLWGFDYSVFPPDLGVADAFAFARRHEADFAQLEQVVRDFAGAVEPFLLDVMSPSDAGTFKAAITDKQTSSEPVTRFKKRFRVVAPDGVKIRRSPTIYAKIQRLLPLNETIAVDLNTRTEADGYAWYEHEEGWSAERPLDNSDAYLVEVTPEEDGEDGGDQSVSELTASSSAAHFTKQVQVVTSALLIRRDHDEDSDSLGSLAFGDIILIDPVTRFEGTSFIWRKHDRGWSAERPVDGSDVFLWEVTPEEAQAASMPIMEFPVDAGEALDVNTLPLRDRLFQSLPTDRAHTYVLQHFGNTRYAFESGVYENFFQGLHSGIDLGNRDKDEVIPVVSGIADRHVAKVADIIRTSYGPVGVRVKAGSYTIIYGHLRDDEHLVAVGTILKSDSLIGNIATREDIASFDATHSNRRLGFSPHLHLEIRFQFMHQTVILNPLLFFTDPVRETLAHRQPTEQEKIAYSQHFYIEANVEPVWAIWGEPFSQPVIRFQVHDKLLIGPRARLGSG